MTVKPAATFWGSTQTAGEDFTPEQARTLLIYEELEPQVPPKHRPARTDDCLTEEERNILYTISKGYTLNARQTLEKLKGPFAPPANFHFHEIGPLHKPPPLPNCFTDGGVDFPTIHWASIPGIGVWWPKPFTSHSDNPPQDENDLTADLVNARTSSAILISKDTNEGTKQWNTIPGQRCSSTRAEVAAVVGALTDPEAIHIGIDNSGALSNIARLVTTATTWARRLLGNPQLDSSQTPAWQSMGHSP